MISKTGIPEAVVGGLTFSSGCWLFIMSRLIQTAVIAQYGMGSSPELGVSSIMVTSALLVLLSTAWMLSGIFLLSLVAERIVEFAFEKCEYRIVKVGDL